MLPSLTFTTFNLLEGAFWLVCAAVTFFLCYRIHTLSKRFWLLLSANFLFFGLSDFVEAYYPVSFFDAGGEWLFAWKLICIGGFLFCFIWYFRVRIFKKMQQ